jgi:hypothetical protein
MIFMYCCLESVIDILMNEIFFKKINSNQSVEYLGFDEL